VQPLATRTASKALSRLSLTRTPSQHHGDDCPGDYHGFTQIDDGLKLAQS
jgi:hypothetical protein